MAKQDKSIQTSREEKDILDLERKYFEKLKNIISSEEFINDLRLIEAEIKLKYADLERIWHIKNKLKVAAERLIPFHIYKTLMPEIKGIYESPISSDLGIEFDDCILCVDCKTLDTKSNSVDIASTSVEPNQTSFSNSNHQYIRAASNLEPRARISRLPLLTYVIKIIYRDDNVCFNISTSTGIGKKPSLVLACIPNGKLERLFDKNLIQNFKTYKYHDKSEDVYYTPITVPDNITDKKAWVESYCLSKGYNKVTIPQNRGTKDVYFDASHNCYWAYTSNNKKKMIMAIKSGNTMRLNNEWLKERYDSANNPWDGYIEMDI